MNSKKIKIADIIGIIFLVFGAGVLIRSACLTVSYDIWFDELFTVELASKPVSQLLSLAASDVHPPLYYLVVRAVYIILNGATRADIICAAKIASVIPYFLLLIYALVFIRKRFGALGAGLGFFWAVTAPKLIEYTVEARMYSWCGVVVAVMFMHAWAAVEAAGSKYGIDPVMNGVLHVTGKTGSGTGRNLTDINQDKKRIKKSYYVNLTAVLIYGICAMYLHYYSAMAAICIVIWMVVKLVFSLHNTSLGNIRSEGISAADSDYIAEKSDDRSKDRVEDRSKDRKEDRSEEKGENRNDVIGSEHIIVSCIACVILGIVAYIPWLKTALSQAGAVKNSYWIQPLTWRIVPGCIKYIFTPEFESQTVNVLLCGVCVVCVAAMFIYLIISSRKDNDTSLHNSATCIDEQSDQHSGYFQERDHICLHNISFITGTFIIPACTILTGIIISFLVKPVFVYRYMIPVLILFWMGCGCMVSHIISYANQIRRTDSTGEGSGKNGSDDHISGNPRGKTNGIAYSLIIGDASALILCMSVIGVHDISGFIGMEKFKAVKMQEAQGIFSEIEKEHGDKMIVCNFNQIQALMWHYLPNDSLLWGETEELLIADICGRSPIIMTADYDELKDMISKRGQDSFLFFGSFNARDEIIEEWEENGASCELIHDSVFVERYYFNVYNIMCNEQSE